jgi:hypothetical protein
MHTQYLTCREAPPVPPYDAAQLAQGLGVQLGSFLFPLLVQLDAVLDKRLVRTFLATIEVIITFRDRANGLLLSELGAYLETPAKVAAGTKRLSNLLHSSKWADWLIARFLWQRASQQLEQWGQAGAEGLVMWDESVWEKPESQHLEGLCAVRSSKAKRLTHYKKGYYSPPSKPIFVPGLQWIGVLLVGRSEQQGPPLLAAMRWWSSRGPLASFKRDEEAKLLLRCVAHWGRQVVHIFDQGFAGGFWLGLLLALDVRFVLRWRKDYQLVDAQGQKRKAWHIARGKRSSRDRFLWDSRRTRWVQASVLMLSVRHPEHSEVALSLVVCRSAGRLPWYLLTEEAVTNEEEAWRVVFAYVRRWHIEQTWRFDKSELAFQSPRVWHWAEREKLLLMAALAYAFLLSLLSPCYDCLRQWLLHHYCHRTGRHSREAKAPLYRLRTALSRLWQQYPPNFALLGQPSPPPMPLLAA